MAGLALQTLASLTPGPKASQVTSPCLSVLISSGGGQCHLTFLPGRMAEGNVKTGFGKHRGEELIL